MSKSCFIVGVVGLVVTVSGCSGAEDSGKIGGPASDSKSPPAATQESTATDTSPGAKAVDCVAAGAKGNEIGVGAFCASSKECAQGTFCTAGSAPKGAEFCTAFCSSDADCGAGAVCYSEARGRACVPSTCLKK
jgi:hypothetical protein